MDWGSALRALIVVLIGVVIVGAMYAISGLSSLQPVINWTSAHIDPLFESVVFRLLGIASAAFITVNYQAVLRFVRRTLARTDELIVGKWFVYRYTKTLGKPRLLTDTWTIRRNIASQYQYDAYIAPLGRHRRRYKGRIISNERDRFSILFEGFDHKELSVISFLPRIPVDGDSRTLGLGVGDDADYVLSARIYLASRIELPEEHAKAVLDDASSAIKSGSKDQLIQLPSDTALEILGMNPLPPNLAPEIEAGLWTRLSGMLRSDPKPSAGT